MAKKDLITPIERDPKWEAVQSELAKPFPPRYINVKPGATSESGYGMMLWFIDARAAMSRLDEIVGPENWSFTWQPLTTLDNKIAIHGKLTVLGVTKEDVGEAQDESEPYKSAVSDSFKRCAVHFGLGRYLYSMPQIWWPYDRSKRRFEDQEALERFIEKVTDRLIELDGDASSLDAMAIKAEVLQGGGGGRYETTSTGTATAAQQEKIKQLQIQKFGATPDARERYDQYQKGVIGRQSRRSELTRLEADKVIKSLMAMPDYTANAA